MAALDFDIIADTDVVLFEEAVLRDGRAVQVREERLCGVRWTWDVVSREGYLLAGGSAGSRKEAISKAVAALN